MQLLLSNANSENTALEINMKYIAMHSMTKVKFDSDNDTAGQLLFVAWNNLNRSSHWRVKWLDINTTDPKLVGWSVKL